MFNKKIKRLNMNLIDDSKYLNISKIKNIQLTIINIY